MSILTEQLATISGIVTATKRQLQNLLDQQTQVNKDIEGTKSRIVVRESSLEVIRTIMTELSVEGVKALAQLIQDGLNIVFNDRNYKVEIEVEDKRGTKQLEFYLIETIEGEVVKSNIRDSVGGSIISVVSFITQVYYIKQSNAVSVIFMDEAFADINKMYYENLFQLMSVFRDKMGFRYLLITHMDEVLPYADSVYQIRDGVVEKVK